MGFIQIIEIETNRPDEVEALVSEWRAKTEGTRTAQRGTFTRDRDRPNTYVQIVEFPSYEDAMANSELPETLSFRRRCASCATGQCCSAISTCKASRRCEGRVTTERRETWVEKLPIAGTFPAKTVAH
jgi:hypothetical protein